MATKYVVTGDQYKSIDRKMREIKRQLDQKSGSPLEPNVVDAALQLILEDDMPAPGFRRDMVKERGWKLESDVGFNPFISSVSDLKIVQFLKFNERNERSISRTELENRAKQLNANLGQQHAEWIFERQDQILGEWLGMYFIFPGTMWRASNDYLFVPYLCWDGDKWRLFFHLLGHRIDSHDRLLCLSK